MSPTRRDFLAASSAAAILGPNALARSSSADAKGSRAEEGASPASPPRVVTPNGASLPFTRSGEVKVFHLVAGPVHHVFAPGLEAECWGYNGRVHGPTIEATEGDRVRLYVTNRLDVPTTVHWHGLFVPNGMDGIGGLTQRPISPGETFRYEFTLRQHGTFMYHSHHDEMTQMALGMMGLFIVHPKEPRAREANRDYAYLLSEWKIDPGSSRPDPNEMTDFNVLTFNGKIFPATEPIVARTGERVRIRIGNLSAMDHHPIHLHGHAFEVVETDGGRIPEAGHWPEVTVLVPVGSTRTIEFVADNPGDWGLHCHMTHHVMTQMGHGIPNLVGVDPSVFDEKLEAIVPEYASMGTGMDEGHSATIPRNSLPMIGGKGPFGYITMSGMVSILKVRDEIDPGVAASWYTHPEGSVAVRATPEQLGEDGIET